MRKIVEVMVVLAVLGTVGGCLFEGQAKQDPPMTVAKRAADSLPAASKGIEASTDKIEGAAKEAQPKAPDQAKVILGEVPVLRGIADAIDKLAATLDKAIGDELTKDKAQIDALNKQIADLKSEAEASMTATFRIGIVISLIFIAISVYMTIQGFVSWALTANLHDYAGRPAGPDALREDRRGHRAGDRLLRGRRGARLHRLRGRESARQTSPRRLRTRKRTWRRPRRPSRAWSLLRRRRSS